MGFTLVVLWNHIKCSHFVFIIKFKNVKNHTYMEEIFDKNLERNNLDVLTILTDICYHVASNKIIITRQPLYNTASYNTVLDITRFKDGSQKCIDYIEK